jgi:dipeptidyl aminopeptidase/acylaminoacyl peptidase
MVPPSVDSRTRVHEYGGASFCPVGDSGDIITSDFKTQGLKLVKNGADGTVHDLVVNETAGLYRFADFTLGRSTGGDRLLYSVREDHTVDEPSAVVNTIVCFPVLSADGSPVVTTPSSHSVLVNPSADPNIMVSNPQVDPSGRFLSWVQWSHPSMPWDDTELRVARLAGDGLSLVSESVCVAGGAGESVMEPVWWTPPGGSAADIYTIFLSDRSDGWWNIHRARITDEVLSQQQPAAVDCVLCCVGYEFGRSAWNFGYRHFDFLPVNRDLLTVWRDGAGVPCVVRLDPLLSHSLDKTDLLADANAARGSSSSSSVGGSSSSGVSSLFIAELPNKDIRNISDIAVDAEGSLFLMGGGPGMPESVCKWNTLPGGGGPFSRATGEAVGALAIVRQSTSLDVNPAYLSIPEVIEFPTVCNGQDCSAFGMFYPPTNPLFEKPVEVAAKPPLLVKLHGGPTGKASTTCRLDIQFFTSRGFAVLDVDYGGSSGYGRAYRNRMQGNWGVVDVEDCCRGAAFLGEKGLVDSGRLCIQGGSAGGYTALASVAFRNVFHAATSSYGKTVC